MKNIAPHAQLAPSGWVQRWSPLVPRGGGVLDLACGTGRHMHWFATRGHAVCGVDRLPDALAALAPLVAEGRAETLLADIEASAWPLAGRVFDAVVVTNYLWRPLWPHILASIAPGGVLIYETFAQGNESVGKPSRADFLLRPGELLQACDSLRVVAFEDGFLDAPARFVQRIAAVRAAPAAGPGQPARFPLQDRPPLETI